VLLSLENMLAKWTNKVAKFRKRAAPSEWFRLLPNKNFRRGQVANPNSCLLAEKSQSCPSK